MNKNKIVIGLVGQIASGKGTIANYYKEKHDASTHRFSTMLRDVLNRLYLEKNRENMQFISTILRQGFGEDLMAKVIAKDVENDPSGIVVVDGVRRFADISYLKKIDGFVLVAITAAPELRHQRLVGRAENPGDKEKTFDQFIADQNNEADAEVPEVMKEADIMIDNNGDINQLIEQLEIIIKERT